LPEVSGQRLVLMGLDHLTGRSGRIFRVVSTGPDWNLQLIAVLDAAPRPWLVDGSRLLFITESGLWSTEPTSPARRFYDAELGNYAATSLVRDANGLIYVGLRHYVLKLEDIGGRWRESWYVPSACQKVQLRQYRCQCVD
jgi:hypothetical protein